MTPAFHQWPPGFGIHARGAAPAPDLVAAYRGTPTAFISDCLGRHVGGLGLRAYHGKDLLCGPAVTVRVRPGDSLMIHKALEVAQPGDVIVVDGSGDLTQAVIGGLMRAVMIARRLGGIVVNGVIRDVAEWQEGGMPVYALGHTHRGPSKDGPGEINVAIACAGLAVSPGDLVCGDLDGVVAIPADELAALLPLIREKEKTENGIRAAIAAGTLKRGRFDAILRSKGCPVPIAEANGSPGPTPTRLLDASVLAR